MHVYTVYTHLCVRVQRASYSSRKMSINYVCARKVGRLFLPHLFGVRVSFLQYSTCSANIAFVGGTVKVSYGKMRLNQSTWLTLTNGVSLPLKSVMRGRKLPQYICFVHQDHLSAVAVLIISNIFLIYSSS